MKKDTFIILLTFLLLLTGSCVADTGSEFCYEEFISSSDSSGKPMILYTGITIPTLTMRSEPDKNSEALGSLPPKSVVEIFGFDQTWLFCWKEGVGVYYIGRHNVEYIEPVDSSVPAYGVMPNRFVAVTSVDTNLYASPSKDADIVVDLAANSRLSFWMIRDGWAIVPYRRLVGYIWLGDLRDLQPVAPSIEYAQEGDILSVFTSFYSTKKTELNIGRMENIRVGSSYISNTLQPGEEFNFNQIAGPYRKARGYLPSPVLVDGGTVAGYGGGTCQVSTTLYNSLLQLGSGIEIIYRRPHGPGGASYAPHGVDAAVGATNLNLIFRNAFSFPITIDATVQNGSLCIAIRKGTWTST